jgi:hypothetical protein
MVPDSQIIPFRGGKKLTDFHTNGRSAWWWQLRRRYERGGIAQMVHDPTLDAQLSQMQYSYTAAGLIRVETKDEMRARGLESPDRADTVMYTFAFSEMLEIPSPADEPQFVVNAGYASDRSEQAMWERDLDPRRRNPPEINAVTGLPDEL